MDTEVFVYVDLADSPILVGRLWTRSRGARESASFEYDGNWLSHEERFALEPALSLGPGPFHTAGNKAIFGAIGDSAPDRWGRTLMRRAERQRALQGGETPRTLREIDFLLRVDDEARQGALRFSTSEEGPYLAEAGGMRIPPLVELPRLLSAADKMADESDTAEELRLLLAPGSSLGGARPKASVRDHDGHLLIAKFAQQDDEIDIVRWEAVALGLARKAGLVVPDWRIENVGEVPVILLRRFDRATNSRIPFLSAMSMLDARDNDRRSYLEMVDALRQYGAAPVADMHALWRRVVFSILISNTDDHLRNHGFLYEGTNGWRLSPAYDLNPVPTDLKPRILSTNIDLDDGTASLPLAYSVAAYFELDEIEAKQIAYEVGRAVSGWRQEAASVGIPKSQIKRMESAFEHDDLRFALEDK
ncbi:putative DNA-binding transcriptional regulator [Polystyrenella longa]|uniref:Putative DNA-binding transcriptional regulator n=1 Tax=Polystyrenella longa TaxID=2528007 RepID=A0A518CTB5_9PLAN|nr:HipA domain-containing protein [Polystyrenella longa]QDU82456.1 putative DNA-binding transcriptional regulator [Polystyrenella longa]